MFTIVRREVHDRPDDGEALRVRVRLSGGDVGDQSGLAGGAVGPPQLQAGMPVARREVDLVAQGHQIPGIGPHRAGIDVRQQLRAGGGDGQSDLSLRKPELGIFSNDANVTA